MHYPGCEETAIDTQDMSRDIACLLACKKYRAKGCFIRCAVAIQRNAGAVDAARLLGMHARDQLGLDGTRSERVGGDLVFGQFHRHHPGQGNHATLGRTIGGASGN